MKMDMRLSKHFKNPIVLEKEIINISELNIKVLGIK